MVRVIVSAILAAAFLVLSACAAGPEEADQGGFFEDYDFGNREDQLDVRRTRDFD